MQERVVLDSPDIDRALKRIAHEILEANEGPTDLVLLGIPTRGKHLAERISSLLTQIDPGYEPKCGVLDITMYRDDATTAIDEVEALLGMAHHRADIDVGRRPCQPDPAEAPAHAFEIARVHQVVDDLHQVVLRQAMLLSQLANRDKALAVRGAVHQHAQRVVGVFGQAHGNP